MVIHLAPALLPGSCDLPGNSGGPPSDVPLFGLAPDGVYLAPAVTDGTGELLPHPFTLTRHSALQTECPAVSFLWHFPSRHRDWALPSILSFGVRTFLPPALSSPASQVKTLHPGSFCGKSLQRRRGLRAECRTATTCSTPTYPPCLPNSFPASPFLHPSK